MNSSPEVTVSLPGCGLEELEREMKRMCVGCLCGVAEFPWGFECACGACFTLALVGTAYTGGEVVMLVEPLLPDSASGSVPELSCSCPAGSYNLGAAHEDYCSKAGD